MKKQHAPKINFWTALHRGNRAAVEAALRVGTDPNAPLRIGKESPNHGLITPLWLAASCGQREICGVLLKHGADLEGGKRWMTPLAEAAAHGQTETVKLLRKHGARVTFFVRVALDDAPAVQRELKKQPDLIRQRDEADRTALHYAARKLSGKMIKLLLKHGADPNARDSQAKSALYAACDRRDATAGETKTTLSLLLAQGADVNAHDVRGVTPLHVAVRARNVAACEILLMHGAKANARGGSRGSTPLRRALFNTGAGGTAGRVKEAEAIRKLLLKHGAKAQDSKQRKQLVG